VGGLLQVLLTLAGRSAVAVGVRVCGGVLELHQPRKRSRVGRVHRDLLLSRLDVVVEGAGGATAAPASEEVAEAEPATARADAEEDETDREDRGEGAEGHSDDAAAAWALQVEKQGAEA